MQHKGKSVLVIGGPTAVGKTAVAIKVAQHLKCEILSADSRQFFKKMDIGTAKPIITELSLVKHHFIDHLSVGDKYNANDFRKDALEELDKQFQTRDVAVLVGGSGLYIKAACEGFDEFPELRPGVREQVVEQYQTNGLGWLQAQLLKVDPLHFQNVDRGNPQRIMRALEICISSGRPYSSFLNQPKPESHFQFIKIALNLDRAELHHRIEDRVDKMIDQGLVDEVKELLPFAAVNAMQTMGYRELVGYFNGEHDLETAIELIKRDTRRFARKQITWFNRDKEMTWFSPNDLEAIIAHIEERMK